MRHDCDPGSVSQRGQRQSAHQTCTRNDSAIDMDMDMDIGDVSDPWDSPSSQETADWTFIGGQASSQGSSTSSSELGLYTEWAQPSWDNSELEVYTEWAQQLWDTFTLTTGAPATRGLPPRWPSLLLVEPSNHCVYNNMTYRLDRRMECLWGNYGTFACTNKVSELFSRTVSDFFGVLCRQMARDVRYNRWIGRLLILMSITVRHGLGGFLCVRFC
jgi:hypothetical protein